MIAHTRKAFWGAAFVAFVISGCAGARIAPRSIEELRARADASPTDAHAAMSVAVAELFAPGGDPSVVRRRVDHALSLSPHDPALHLASAVEHDQHGALEDAATEYLATLESVGTDELDPIIAEVAAAALEDLSETAPRFAETVDDRLATLLASTHHLGPAAAEKISEIRSELAYRRGDLDAARAVSRRAGCIDEWRVAGPFGPRDLIGFDDPNPAVANGPMADHYDLGPGRGVRATRTVQAKGCAVHLGAGPVTAGGTTVAEAFVQIDHGGDYVLRLETPNSVELFVDGRSAKRLDARRVPIARVNYVPVHLDAGRHELTVKVATRHPNPILSVALMTTSGHGANEGGSNGEFSEIDPGPSTWLRVYLRGARAMARGDFVAARELLREPTTPDNASSTLLILESAAVLSDPLRSDSLRRDDARALLRRAAQRDAAAWYPALQFSRLEAADAQPTTAIAGLRASVERWPNVIAFRIALSDLLEGRGWDADADREIASARQAAPGTCLPIKAAFDAARRRNHTHLATDLAEELVRCDARADARFGMLVRARRWQDAQTELSRLETFEPPSNRFGILSARLDLDRNLGDDTGFRETLRSLSELVPRNDSMPLSLADRLLSLGQTTEARHVLDEALLREPAAMSELRRVRAAIGGMNEIAPFRMDGARVIHDFEASGRHYDQPQALIFDYTVVRVFEDGSTLELTHNIYKVQSEEAVDEQGEFRLPDGARLLQLHTVKPDGRRLEPDQIAGKETISLPDLAAGDYVEFEYVNTGEPPPGFPGGYLGDRFYFQGFEVPFDRSELTVVMPESMHPIIDPRGPAPSTEQRVENGLRILHFGVHESRPLVAEPMSVAQREFIPSVNVGVGATWELFMDGIRDLLSDRDVRDPAAERVLGEIIGTEEGASPEARARKIYAWVLEHVEDNGDAFGLASSMLAARTGNRARVLHYLLGLAGVDSDLALARSKAADATPGLLPDGDTYESLLVRARFGGTARWLSTADRGAPFGYLPPLLRGQDALIVAAGAPRARVDDAPPETDQRSLDIDVGVRADGSARIDVTETTRGIGAVVWRNQLESIPHQDLERRFESEYVARLVAGATLATLDIRGRDNPEEPLVLEYSFDVASLGRRVNGGVALGGLFPTRLSPILARVSERHTTAINGTPVHVDVAMRIHLPSGIATPSLPAPTDLASGDAHFHMAVARADDGFSLARRVDVPVERVSPTEYPALAQFCRAVDESEARELVIALPAAAAAPAAPAAAETTLAPAAASTATPPPAAATTAARAGSP